jgi:MerR family transcriptional regulator, heat shock protein HspR
LASSIDDPQAAIYTVGQVAGLLGVQAAFLRRLDSERLVQPARSEGGQRRYSRDEMRRVERVVELMSEGLTLTAIRRLLVLEGEVAELHRSLADEQAKNSRTQIPPAPPARDPAQAARRRQSR